MDGNLLRPKTGPSLRNRSSGGMAGCRFLEGVPNLASVDDIDEDLQFWFFRCRLIKEGAEVSVGRFRPPTMDTGKHGCPSVSDRATAEGQDPDLDGITLPVGLPPHRFQRLPQVKSLMYFLTVVETDCTDC